MACHSDSPEPGLRIMRSTRRRQPAERRAPHQPRVYEGEGRTGQQQAEHIRINESDRGVYGELDSLGIHAGADTALKDRPHAEAGKGQLQADCSQQGSGPGGLEHARPDLPIMRFRKPQLLCGTLSY